MRPAGTLLFFFESHALRVCGSSFFPLLHHRPQCSFNESNVCFFLTLSLYLCVASRGICVAAKQRAEVMAAPHNCSWINILEKYLMSHEGYYYKDVYTYIDRMRMNCTILCAISLLLLLLVNGLVLQCFSFAPFRAYASLSLSLNMCCEAYINRRYLNPRIKYQSFIVCYSCVCVCG